MNLINKYEACLDAILVKTKQTKVVLSENKRRYSLWNPNNDWEISKVKVENCITSGSGEKGCEAILIAEKKHHDPLGFYVELKGCSVGDALKQIDNSLNKTVGDLKGVKLFGRIIPTEYKRNKFLESFQQRLILRFKQFGGDFIIKENHEDRI